MAKKVAKKVAKKKVAKKKVAKKKATKSPIERLYEAATDHDAEKVRALLAAGADPNARHDDYTYSVLMCSVLPMGNEEIAVALAEGGANPNEADQYGFTPLHYAAHLDRPRSVAALLRAGADANAVSTKRSPSFEGMTKGATPLKVADDPESKTLLAAATTVGLATDAFSKKLEKVRDWYSQALDFEGGEPEADALAGFDTEGYLFPIGQTGDGSVYALWSPERLEAPKDGPVVYLDSEGDPYTAVAGSLDAFLSVLPYGRGWLHDAASSKAQDAQQALATVAEEMTSEEGVESPQHAFGVDPASNPDAVVESAQTAKPSFRDWLETMG